MRNLLLSALTRDCHKKKLKTTLDFSNYVYVYFIKVLKFANRTAMISFVLKRFSSTKMLAGIQTVK